MIDSITAEIESQELKTLYNDNIKDQIIIKGEPFEITNLNKRGNAYFYFLKIMVFIIFNKIAFNLQQQLIVQVMI